ncbi:hypothetical protein DENSPDRAFT_74095 [Dentipellis sp. KUC8613]|nr:hypothetical protein DENSPDRAFT_74095 [Dentipellis sp. KUC8613]
MVAYELDGLTTVSPIDMDGDNFSWRVNHPTGSQLVLSLVDSEGNSGGVLPSVYGVSGGGSPSCLSSVPSPSTRPVLSANVTKGLSTCQSLGLTMSGGVRPYTVSIAEVGSATSNFTLAPEDDSFSYINHAASSTALLVSMSDAAGNWAARTILVDTLSSGASCPGVSSAGSVDEVPIGFTTAQNVSDKHHIIAIVGACLGAAVGILLLCLALLFLFLRRRAIKARNMMDGQDILPRAWADEQTIIVSRRTSKLDLNEDRAAWTFDSPVSRASSETAPRASSPCSPYVIAPTPVFKPFGYPSRAADVLDISAGNRPLSPLSPSPLRRDPPSRLSSPAPPSRSPTPDTIPRPFLIPTPPIRPHVPSPPPIAPLSLATNLHYRTSNSTYTSSSRSPTPAFSPTPISPRPLPSPPQASPSRAALRKAQEAGDHPRTAQQLRSVRSTGDMRRSGTMPAHAGLTVHNHNRPRNTAPLSRARSMLSVQPGDLVFPRGAVRESWVQDRAGRDTVVIQHRDAAFLQELPPPYEESLASPISFSPLSPS